MRDGAPSPDWSGRLVEAGGEEWRIAFPVAAMRELSLANGQLYRHWQLWGQYVGGGEDGRGPWADFCLVVADIALRCGGDGKRVEDLQAAGGPLAIMTVATEAISLALHIEPEDRAEGND